MFALKKCQLTKTSYFVFILHQPETEIFLLFNPELHGVSTYRLIIQSFLQSRSEGSTVEN